MADNAINIILKAKTADACKNIKRASNEIKQLGHNFNKARNDLRNFKMHVSSLGALFDNMKKLCTSGSMGFLAKKEVHVCIIWELIFIKSILFQLLWIKRGKF
ncbi:MAG: hypothetical protein KIIPBIDF_01566 [Candidatus Methanoperedenaceae archaeon GB50]|nr:MAG: hypothetical protein KIIPBIDF_01566 [Candidatus Methanoperedenaceae archaeon GB50]